jgi:predicted PurR-regulated permease PerM
MDNSRTAAISGSIIVIFISGLILRLAKPVLFPFFLAIFFYFILSPVLDILTRIRIPRWVSIVVIILVTFSVLYLLSVLFYSSGKAFASELPRYSQKFNSILESIRKFFEARGSQWDPLAWVRNLNVDKIAAFILSSLGPFFSFLTNLFLIFIFLIFMLAGRGKTKAKIENSFNPERAEKILGVIRNIDKQVQKYLVIKTLSNLITGVMAAVVLVIFGVDFAVVFGFLTFLLNYIPNIGSFIATALPVLIAAFQFETLWPAFWVFIIITAFNLVISNVLEPKLMGQGLGLSPLFVLFALFFWGWLWGIPGMILAVPIVVIIKIVCSNIPSLRFIEVLMSK